MTNIQIGTYALGLGQAVYGLIGLVLGWMDSGTAIQLIISGVAVFGLTHQNVALGRQL